MHKVFNKTGLIPVTIKDLTFNNSTTTNERVQRLTTCAKMCQFKLACLHK